MLTQACTAARIGLALSLAAAYAPVAVSAPSDDAIVAEVYRLAMADLARRAAADGEPAPDVDGPIVGMPPPDQLVLGRMDVWMNPVYWSTWVQEALLNGNVQIPAPTDIVRPEIWTPNVAVASDPAYISPLPTALRDTSQMTYEWGGATKTVADFVATTETDGIVWVLNGALVDEIYNNGYTAETRHQPWSVTKTFIAATVGIARDEGLIPDLQAPIESYIPELAGTAWEGVTIENILQMESGVHWDEDTPVLAQNTQVEQWVQVALDYYTQGQLGQTRNEFLAALPKSYEQGTQFRYNSGNTQVLAWMLEKLYGKTYNQIIEEKIWKPMGAWGDARMIADREGGVIASQGLYARPRDFARFGEVMRNFGLNSDGRRILPADWVAAMTAMTSVSAGRYGYQTWASPAGAGAYQASGFQGQKITVVPDQCLTAVRTAHSFGLDYRDGDDPLDPDAYGFSTNFSADEWNAVVAAVAQQLGGCSGSAKPAARTDAWGGALSLPLLLGLMAAGLRRRRR
jgi:CubicO group peptidase (beta-lactamase class C family)